MSFENASPSSVQPGSPAVSRRSPSWRRIYTLWGAEWLHLMGLWEVGCWEATWGFDQMSNGHVLHSLTFISQNLFSTLDCSWYDLMVMALIRPACQLDTNGHGWYFTSILQQSHPASPDTSESLSVDNYQCCILLFCLFFLFSCVISCLFGSPSWINAQTEIKKNTDTNVIFLLWGESNIVVGF